MLNIQGEGEAALEDGQVKSVGDETHVIGEDDEPFEHEQVVNEKAPVDQP